MFESLRARIVLTESVATLVGAGLSAVNACNRGQRWSTLLSAFAAFLAAGDLHRRNSRRNLWSVNSHGFFADGVGNLQEQINITGAFDRQVRQMGEDARRSEGIGAFSGTFAKWKKRLAGGQKSTNCRS